MHASPPQLTLLTASSAKSETRPNSSHYASNGMSRTAMPPTPPMSTDASFEGHGSPSTRSVSQVSVVSAPNYYYESTPPLEADVQRHQLSASAIPRVAMPAPTYPQQPYAAPSYINQPALSYYSAVQPPAQPQISGLYYQRPLPQVLLTLIHLTETSRLIERRHSHLLQSRSQCRLPLEQARGNTNIITISRHLPQQPFRNPRIATSARLAIRHFLGPAPSEFTATRTQARSLSSARTLGAERLSASGAT